MELKDFLVSCWYHLISCWLPIINSPDICSQSLSVTSWQHCFHGYFDTWWVPSSHTYCICIHFLVVNVHAKQFLQLCLNFCKLGCIKERFALRNLQTVLFIQIFFHCKTQHFSLLPSFSMKSTHSSMLPGFLTLHKKKNLWLLPLISLTALALCIYLQYK